MQIVILRNFSIFSTFNKCFATSSEFSNAFLNKLLGCHSSSYVLFTSSFTTMSIHRLHIVSLQTTKFIMYS